MSGKLRIAFQFSMHLQAVILCLPGILSIARLGLLVVIGNNREESEIGLPSSRATLET